MNRLDLEDRLIDFAVRVIVVAESLPSTKAGTHVAGQLARSGTATAAIYGEAQSAESRRDFIHKMKIALKELRESLVWLKIIQRKPLCSPNRMEGIVQECNELVAIFTKSILTAQSNLTHEEEAPYTMDIHADPIPIQ